MSQALWAALGKVIDPELRLPLTELDMIASASVEGSKAVIEVKLTVVGCPAAKKIERDVREAAVSVPGVEAVEIKMGVMTRDERDALKLKLRNGRPARTNPFGAESLTKIYLIGSGKGGVGKSSLTANLAVELAQRGHRVGLVDADIFGFSIPGQLAKGFESEGVENPGKPTRVDEMILPPVAFGVKVISIGMFLEENKPVAWRGPMLHRAVEQFLVDVFWGDLDYLLIDVPPGTGDIAISLGQLLPTAKTVVVTTPQQAAAEVAERSGSVGLQTGQAIFGVIENMSYLLQPDGSRLEIFGRGGGEVVATRLSERSGKPVALLGSVPISVALREGSDLGLPIVVADREDPAGQAIRSIADSFENDSIGLVGKRLNLASKS
jgi:ATP-binding protein involved in chromosome partitioning